MAQQLLYVELINVGLISEIRGNETERELVCASFVVRPLKTTVPVPFHIYDCISLTRNSEPVLDSGTNLLLDERSLPFFLLLNSSTTIRVNVPQSHTDRRKTYHLTTSPCRIRATYRDKK